MSFESKKYWFKNKQYGLGWTPASWQGWVVILSHAVFAIGVAIYAEETGLIDREPGKFVVLILAIVALLLAVAWKTGEPLKWRWGKKK